MKTTIKSDYQSEILEKHGDKKIILLTAHRREKYWATYAQYF